MSPSNYSVKILRQHGWKSTVSWWIQKRKFTFLPSGKLGFWTCLIHRVWQDLHSFTAAFSPRNVVCRDYGYGRWRMTGTRFKRGKYLSSPSYPRMCCFFSTNGEQIRCHLTSSSAQESNVHHSATGVYYWAGRTLNAIACYVAGDANDFCHMEAQEKLLLMLLEDVKVGGGRKCRLARSVWFLLSEQKKKKAAACVLEH